MNRRKFIQQTFVAGIGIAVSPNLLASSKSNYRKLTILHTNDTHSHIDPFPAHHAKYPGLGGAARRASMIQAIREQEENVLLFDAGDIFQGTPYFNQFHGVLEMKLMSEMKYDASTMGNHDFDIGLAGFLNAKQSANFPFLVANYDFSNTLLKDKTFPHQIFVKNGIKVGVFGLGVELTGLVSDNRYEETQYLDPLPIANRIASQLKNDEKCDVVICLSHLGYEYKDNKVSDCVLAKETSNIDFIIGGHTHTFLAQPTVLLNKEGENVIVNQVGWAGVNLGRVDFYLGDRPSQQSDLILVH